MDIIGTPKTTNSMTSETNQTLDLFRIQEIKFH